MSNLLLDPKAMTLMMLQGNIRMLLMRHGVGQEKSLDIACDIVDSLMKDSVVKEEFALFYEALQAQSTQE
jgi:hypothetical protein